MGIIPAGKLLTFQKQLFRLTKGNFFGEFSSIENSYIQDPSLINVEKNVFFLTYNHSSESVLAKQIAKLADIFEMTEYKIPQNYDSLNKQLKEEIQNNIQINQIYLQSKLQYQQFLVKLT